MLNSYFVQHMQPCMKLCKDHTSEIWQTRGLNASFLTFKLTHEEINSTWFNISLQEGHSLSFANDTEIVFTTSWFTALLLHTLKMYLKNAQRLLLSNTVWHRNTQSFFLIPHLPCFQSLIQKWGERGEKTKENNHTSTTSTIHLRFIGAYLKQIKFLRYTNFWLDRVLGNLLKLPLLEQKHWISQITWSQGSLPT